MDSCLSNMKLAFKYHKPVTISSHRVNYIGAIDVSNRDYGLNQLKILLKKIVQTWPEVEFLTSEELGKLIETQ